MKEEKSEPPVIALTGCMGSGKSTVLSIFQSLESKVLSADQLAREVVAPDSPGLKQIVETFGREVLDDSGALNRQKLGKIVFSSTEKRKTLEKITHPLIRKLSSSRIRDFKNLPHPPTLIVYEIPLYFESALEYPEISRVVVVSAPESLCVQRALERGGLDEEEIRKRLDSQWPIAEKAKRADYVIDNSSTVEELRLQVEEIHRHIVQAKA